VRGRPKHDADGASAYGRVEYFLIINNDELLDLIDFDQQSIDDEELPTTSLALAVISLIPSFKRLKDCNLITYKLIGDRLGPVEVVDVENLECLVGRVSDHGGNWYVVDRTTVVGKVDFVNSVMDPN
jgi:hypothetical protein